MASTIAVSVRLGACCHVGAYGQHMRSWAPQAGQHPSVKCGHVSSPCHNGDAAHSAFQARAKSGVRLWSAVCATSVAIGTRCLITRGTSLKGRTTRNASDRNARGLPSLQLGTKLTGIVQILVDAGAFLLSDQGLRLFLPNVRMLRQNDDYTVGEKLQVTVIRLRRKEVKSDVVQVTDMDLKPLSSLREIPLWMAEWFISQIIASYSTSICQ